MNGDMANVMRAFDHLIELLEDEGVDMTIIHVIENAKEMIEEELHNQADTVDLD